MKPINLLLIPLLIGMSCTQKSKKEPTDTEEVVSHEHHAHNQDSPAEKPKSLSPRKATMANIGDNHVHIDYSSPGKRGRMIFGGLVGYGQVWVTGAHKATNITFSKAVKVGDVTIEAGKYGFFTIPEKDKWTIIISKDWDMHLADDYTPDNDVIRLEAPVENLDEPVESLTFEIEETKKGTSEISVSWDKTKITFQAVNE
ncbi:MAG: DUF2911 domain-containing protein [Cyclobacteriaceae bacterium]